MYDIDKKPLNGRTLDIFFKRIVDKKKVCTLSKKSGDGWERKETFRCRTAEHDARENRFLIVRLGSDKRIVLKGWDFEFSQDAGVLKLSNGLWMLSCELDPSDIKWIKMRLR